MKDLIQFRIEVADLMVKNYAIWEDHVQGIMDRYASFLKSEFGRHTSSADTAAKMSGLIGVHIVKPGTEPDALDFLNAIHDVSKSVRKDGDR